MAFQDSFRRSLVLILAPLSSVVLFNSCSGGSGSEDAGAEVLMPGQEIFETNCVACHGYDGKAGVGGAIDLTKSGLNEAGIEDIINNGRNAMVSQKHVYNTDQELQELIQYVISLREKE